MADYIVSLIVPSGPPDALAGLARRHLQGNAFDFNSVCPMPPELNVESDSAVETGYAALYGDWRTEAGRWMFKEPAETFGFPFPLESREQVIRCLESFDCADLYLARAKIFRDNVDRYGHGDWYGWRIERWGTKWNADEIRVRIDAGTVAFSFVTPNAYPKPILRDLSIAYPDLSFHVRYCDESCRRARDFILSKGRETRKLKRPPRDIAAEIEDFRASVAAETS